MTDKVKDAQHDDCFAAFKAAEARADRLQQWKEAVEIAWTAGMLGMEHASLMGGKKLSAHEFITSLKVAMRKAETEFQATNPRRPLLCGLCQHTLVDNSHGADQNDFNGDQHSGRCSYCKFCNGFVAAPVPEPERLTGWLCTKCGCVSPTPPCEHLLAGWKKAEPPARKDELGTCQYHGHTGFKHEHRLICIDWTSVAPQASPEASKEMVILRPCKCSHGWESHEPGKCNESLCRCEEFRPVASPEKK